MTDRTTIEHLRQLLLRGREIMRPVLPRRWRAGVAIVPVLRLSGVIGFSTPLRPGLTIGGLARALDRLFAVRRAAAVALVINSPGGSAVQSQLIFRRVRQLAEEKQIPVLVFVEDVAASGGYMIACAGDEIICDPSSIVGSIGVVGASFGFDEAIKKLGIERRVCTAGEARGRGASQDHSARDPCDLHRSGQGPPDVESDGPRGQIVFRRVLGRQDRARLRPDRSDRRSALGPARTLR